MRELEMKIGLFIGGATYLDVVDGLAVSAERLGYHSFWLGDHMFIPDQFYIAAGNDPKKGECPYLEAWTTLAAISKVTKRLRIGTLVTPLPMRNPGILAKEVATVDFLSGGRVTLGVGVGWHEREFEAYGIPYDDFKTRFEKTIEGLEIIRRLWTEPFVTYKGKYYELNSAPLWPKPVQKPHPPVWFGGVSKRIIDAMVKYGNGWAPYCPSPEQFAELNATARKLIKNAGRKPEEVEIGAVVLAYIGASYDDARKFVEPIIKVRGSRTLKAESWDEAEKCSVFGGPDECIEKVEEYKKAGVQHLLFEMISPGVAMECTKRMGKKVLPYFKEGGK